jgi:hypothetical protein
VAGALYKKAVGYEHPAEKIFLSKDGQVVRVPYIQHYPPDTPALMYYLNNRQRALWFNKPDASANFNFNLEVIVLNALKLTEARQAKGKELDHATGEDDVPKLLEDDRDD